MVKLAQASSIRSTTFTSCWKDLRFQLELYKALIEVACAVLQLVDPGIRSKLTSQALFTF